MIEMFNKTAIITGVTGQDGSHLTRELLQKNYTVIGALRRSSYSNTWRIDDLLNGPNKNKKLILEYIDLNDLISISNLVSKYKPDEYYNLAALSQVRLSFDMPKATMDSIINGTLFALEAIRTLSPMTKFYQASSSEMFGDSPQYPFNEDSYFQPASPYGIAKVAAHNLVRNYRVSYGLFASSGLLFNHTGPQRGRDFVCKKITRTAARIKVGLENEISLGSLWPKRDFGYAPEFTYYMWRILQQQNPDDWVLGTGKTYSIGEFLQKTFDLAGLEVEKYLKEDKNLFRKHEVPCLVADASKAREILNFNPKVDIDQLIKIMYDFDLKEALMEKIEGKKNE